MGPIHGGGHHSFTHIISLLFQLASSRMALSKLGGLVYGICFILLGDIYLFFFFWIGIGVSAFLFISAIGIRSLLHVQRTATTTRSCHSLPIGLGSCYIYHQKQACTFCHLTSSYPREALLPASIESLTISCNCFPCPLSFTVNNYRFFPLLSSASTTSTK